MTEKRTLPPALSPAQQPEQIHPEYRALLKDLMRVADEHGEDALKQEPHATNFARMLIVAPQSYYAQLDARVPGEGGAWRAWATDHIERHDHPEFFQLLEQIGDIGREHGEEAPHRPEHAGLFVRLIQTAPPRYRAEADAIADQSGLIPKHTHVNDDGEPVFGLQQLADHIGVPADELRAFADEHVAANAVYRGTVYPIQ